MYFWIFHIHSHVRVNKTFSFLGLLFFSSYDYGTYNVNRSGDGRYPWLSLGLKGKDYSIKDDICSNFAFIYTYMSIYICILLSEKRMLIFSVVFHLLFFN